MTRSSRGIGAATALRLAQHGAEVAVIYVNSVAAAESVAEKIKSFGVKAITVKADVSKETDIKALFEEVMEEFGRLDIVLSNAALSTSVAFLPSEAKIDNILRVNVKGQFFVTQQAYKHLADNGRLILMSSISSFKVENRNSSNDNLATLI